MKKVAIFGSARTDSDSNLYKAVEKLGKKYNQDSVLIQRKKGATIKGTSKTSWPGKGKNVKVGKMRPGRTGEFDTTVKKKTFTYEENIPT